MNITLHSLYKLQLNFLSTLGSLLFYEDDL